MVFGMLKNKNQITLKDEMINITKPLKEIIVLQEKIGTISQLKTVIQSSPLHFKFGFKFYNYYDVIFEYENEKITWKAISCKKGEEEITNNKLYNPMESQEIVNDIDNILKLKIPQKYLQTLNGSNCCIVRSSAPAIHDIRSQACHFLPLTAVPRTAEST